MLTTGEIVKGVIDEIAGCSPGRMKTVSGKEVHGSFTGWGPTLHQADMVLAFTPETQDETGVRDAMEKCIARQKSRLAAAMALGLDPDRKQDVAEVGHIVTDPLTHLLHDRAVEWARDLMYELYRKKRAAVEDGARIHDMTVTEARILRNDDDGDDRPRLLIQKTMKWGWTDGRSILVNAEIAETMIHGVPGMRLCNVVDLPYEEHPAMEMLKERIVTHCNQTDGRLFIGTAAGWSPLMNDACAA